MDGVIARGMAALNSHAQFLSELAGRLTMVRGASGSSGRAVLTEGWPV